jgi:hypothetical protein
MLIRDINNPKESAIRALYNILRCFGRKHPMPVSLLDCEELINNEIDFSFGGEYFYIPELKTAEEVQQWIYKHIKHPIRPIMGDLIYGKPYKNERSHQGGVLFFVRYNTGKAILTDKLKPGWYKIDKDFTTYSVATYVGANYPIYLEDYLKHIAPNNLHPEELVEPIGEEII